MRSSSAAPTATLGSVLAFRWFCSIGLGSAAPAAALCLEIVLQRCTSMPAFGFGRSRPASVSVLVVLLVVLATNTPP
ncbi:uncharacterized protein ARMOST_12699 [Armillaria ostoyae]|uniref:Uncharacterized protein n=1 Tax=Armillaria ostoyae TaxID=47428 RepID=A0A284RKP2_ARMOS|nr:uncharacterized protein ARMOST_12699 [Armillaria ostoyae]